MINNSPSQTLTSIRGLPNIEWISKLVTSWSEDGVVIFSMNWYMGFIPNSTGMTQPWLDPVVLKDLDIGYTNVVGYRVYCVFVFAVLFSTLTAWQHVPILLCFDWLTAQPFADLGVECWGCCCWSHSPPQAQSNPGWALRSNCSPRMLGWGWRMGLGRHARDKARHQYIWTCSLLLEKTIAQLTSLTMQFVTTAVRVDSISI